MARSGWNKLRCMAGNARTPKARALGNALREAREGCGLSLRRLAGELGRDPGVLSRWESGERVPKPTDVAQILTLLGVNGSRYDEIVELTTGTSEPRWLAVTLPEQRQQLAALLDFERTATTITEVSPLLIPGLLQSGGYVRAIMSGGGVPADEVETRIAVRIGRREVIARRDPVHLCALVGETALRQVVGGREVMLEQLEHLQEISQWPNIELRIVPFTCGWNPALEGPFLLIDSDHAMPVVQIENRRSGLFLHEVQDIDTYRRAAEHVRHVTLSPERSLELIGEAMKEVEAAC